jgi:LAO/AO transport system kinase
MSLDDLVALARSGDHRSLARVATILENPSNESETVRKLLSDHRGRAHIVGITGPPGAGKSSLLAKIASSLSATGKSVAVIAIDPTSPLSGGATLGDRIRMSEASLHGKVFVRSVASRNRTDGLAPAAMDLVRLFDAAGFDYVFLETVGSGQNQIEVAKIVHTLVLVETPGAGDSVQMLKAGIMELADIFAVTKSDLPGAHAVARELRSMLSLSEESAHHWQPPIVLCSSETEEGVSKLIEAIDLHAAHLADTIDAEEPNFEQARAEMRNAALELVERQIADHPELVTEVADGNRTPGEAVRLILKSLI